MTTFKVRCLGCGVEMDHSYRYQYCHACRQLEATERLAQSQSSSGYSGGHGGVGSGGHGGVGSGGGGSGYSGGGGADDYDLTGKFLVLCGIIGVYWMWHPAWLVIKFFGSILFGIED